MRPGEKLQRDGVSQPANEKTCLCFWNELDIFFAQIRRGKRDNFP